MTSPGCDCPGAPMPAPLLMITTPFQFYYVDNVIGYHLSMKACSMCLRVNVVVVKYSCQLSVREQRSLPYGTEIALIYLSKFYIV